MSRSLRTDRVEMERWAEELARSPVREQPPTTVSGRPIEPLYTHDDLIGFGDESDLGYPGQYPFARGVARDQKRGEEGGAEGDGEDRKHGATAAPADAAARERDRVAPSHVVSSLPSDRRSRRRASAATSSSISERFPFPQTSS